MRIANLFLVTLLSLGMCYASDINTSPMEVVTNTEFVPGAEVVFFRGRVTKTEGMALRKTGICWSLHKNPTINDQLVYSTVPSRIFLVKATGLTPKTLYYARAFAIDAKEGISYGEVIPFATVAKGAITMHKQYDLNSDPTNASFIRLNASADACKKYYEELTPIKKTLWVNYSPGTPTADASYGGWMNFGSGEGYQKTGTMLHEINHTMGAGQCNEWWEWMTNGVWQGEYANQVLRFLTGNNSIYIRGDNMHWWPSANTYGSFGVNGHWEDNGKDDLYYTNVLVTYAMCIDGMVSSNGGMPYPGPLFKHDTEKKYYLKPNGDSFGRYKSYLIEQNGALRLVKSTIDEVIANDYAAWFIAYDVLSQRYSFRNAASGRYISITAPKASGYGSVSLEEKAALSPEVLFQLVQSSSIKSEEFQDKKINPRGYNLVCELSNNPSLQVTGSSLVFTSYSKETAQQKWLILDQEELSVLEKKVPTGLDSLTPTSKLTISTSGTTLFVSGFEGTALVQVYSVSGVCMGKQTATNECHFDLLEGNYIVQAVFADGTTESRQTVVFQ